MTCPHCGSDDTLCGKDWKCLDCGCEWEGGRIMQEGIYHDNFGGHAHPLVAQNKALLARHAALVEACQALLGAYSNGEFEPSMRLPLVVRESALKIAKIANAKVARLLEDK